MNWHSLLHYSQVHGYMSRLLSYAITNDEVLAIAGFKKLSTK